MRGRHFFYHCIVQLVVLFSIVVYMLCQRSMWYYSFSLCRKLLLICAGLISHHRWGVSNFSVAWQAFFLSLYCPITCLIFHSSIHAMSQGGVSIQCMKYNFIWKNERKIWSSSYSTDINLTWTPHKLNLTARKIGSRDISEQRIERCEMFKEHIHAQALRACMAFLTCPISQQ